MPVSLSHRLIFVHVPRTGGTSINEALRAAGCYGEARLTYVDLEMDVLYGVLTCGDGALELDHCLLRHYETFLTRQTFMESFAFAVVRHPVDKVLSEFRYKLDRNSSRGFAPTDDLDTFLARTEALLAERDRRSHFDLSHVLPQTEFVTCPGRPIDRLVRFERVAVEVPAILRERGVEAALPELNRAPGELVPSPAQRRAIEALYPDDMALYESLA